MNHPIPQLLSSLVMQVRQLTVYVDESGMRAPNETCAMVGIVTNGTPLCERQLSDFIRPLRVRLGDRWKAIQWKRRDVVRLAAFIRAKGWIILEGHYKPPGDLDSVERNFLMYLHDSGYPIDDSIKMHLESEIRSLEDRERVWLIALYDVVRNLHSRGNIAVGPWIFHQGQRRSVTFMNHFLNYSVGAQAPETWVEFHQHYGLSLVDCFESRFASEKQVDGLLIADYCAHFYHGMIRPMHYRTPVDVEGYKLFRRILATPEHHKDLLSPYADVNLWLDAVADIYEHYERNGGAATTERYRDDAYYASVARWMHKGRFFEENSGSFTQGNDGT